MRNSNNGRKVVRRRYGTWLYNAWFTKILNITLLYREYTTANLPKRWIILFKDI
jgi:hypothetical protein